MLRIRQIVFVVRDLATTSRQLAGLLALDPPCRDPGVAGSASTTRCTRSAASSSADRRSRTVRRRVAPERRGRGGYMLILQTDDFDRDRARVRALGVRTVWEKDLPDIRAMHLHPKDIGGAIVSIDQPVPAASWRWGGPWRRQDGRRGDQCVVAVTVEATRPRGAALGASAGAGCGGAGRRRRPHRADAGLHRVRSRRRTRGGPCGLDMGGGRPRGGEAGGT